MAEALHKALILVVVLLQVLFFWRDFGHAHVWSLSMDVWSSAVFHDTGSGMGHNKSAELTWVKKIGEY